MQTKLWHLINKSGKEELAEAADLIKAGELVAFPTETVYGLGADGLNPEACKKIFAAKGRPADNPLILHISKLEEIYRLTSGLSDTALKLAEAFWPGPMTMIVRKSPLVPQIVTAGLDTVAVRMPSNKIANTLIALAGCPIAAPSANKSGRPSPTRAEDVLADMDGIIAGVIDGGPCDIGVESTIVDTTEEVATILRPGGITLEMLEQVLGKVRIDPGLVLPNQVPKAPGMKYKHYAPKAAMYLIEGPEAAQGVIKAVKLAMATGSKIGVVAAASTIAQLPASQQLICHSWENTQQDMAEKLFTYLRRFDGEKVDFIIGEGTSEHNLGLAIMNRMRKSAAHNIFVAKEGKLFWHSGKIPKFLEESVLK
jgi:L-threonylcarbamoyladenylate synthase